MLYVRSPAIAVRHVIAGQIVDERASITQIAVSPFDSRLRRNVAVIKPTQSSWSRYPVIFHSESLRT